MFTKVLVLSCLVAVLFADEVPILSQDSDIAPDGSSFSWSYKSGDGSSQDQSGDANGVSGSASWVDPDGVPHGLTYQAGEGGYQAQGDDVPVAPEVPAQIARALDWIAAHPQPEE